METEHIKHLTYVQTLNRQSTRHHSESDNVQNDAKLSNYVFYLW